MLRNQYEACLDRFELIEECLGDLKLAFTDASLLIKVLQDPTRKENWHVTCEVQESFAETPFATAVRKEIARARDELKYPPMNSVHEAYAVIKEELEEFWEQCRRKPTAREKQEMYKELVQISAMAQRTAEDLKLGGES